MDAMMAGRAIVASDIAPIRWALADTGLIVPPGDVDALVTALAGLRDRTIRQQYGVAAHARALAMFSVEAVAPTLDELIAALRAVPVRSA
jgi:glycosyltransferase involved in cell wall biosynthesis